MIDRIAINPQYLNNSEDECDIQEMHTTKYKITKLYQ